MNADEHEVTRTFKQIVRSIWVIRQYAPPICFPPLHQTTQPRGARANEVGKTADELRARDDDRYASNVVCERS